MDTSEPDSKKQDVVLCADKSIGWLALLFFAMGAFTLWLTVADYRIGTSDAKGVGVVYGAMSCLLAVGGWLHVLRHQIVADADGLRWRGAFTRWHCAAWRDISDYYHLRHGTPVVRYGDRTQTLYPHTAVEMDALKVRIQERATSARVDHWAPLGARRVDPFPQTFRYYAPERRYWYALGVLVSVLFCVGLTGGSIIAASPVVRVLGWQESVPLIVGIALIMLTTLFVPWSVIAGWRDAYRKRGETVTVTPETVAYTNAATGETLEASWRDVSDYFYRRGKYVLVLTGADETQIEWTPRLHNAALLLAIVQAFAPAPNAAQTGTSGFRVQTAHEATGGDPSTWQGGAVGMGGRVFRNHSPNDVWGLVALTACVVIVVGYCVAEWVQPGVKDERWLALGTTALFVLPTVWAWWCYFVTRVETDDMGLTQWTPFGKTTVPWFAVTDYREKVLGGKPLDHIVVTGHNGKRLRLFSTLNGYADLKREIERYAPVPRTGQ